MKALFDKRELVVTLWSWCRNLGREEYFFELVQILAEIEEDFEREKRSAA